MKNKLKEFFKTKKELFVFLGLIAMTFVGVIAIAQVTVTPNIEQDQETNVPEDETVTPEDDNTNDTVVVATFNAPTASYVIVREFYDIETNVDNENAIIETSTSMVMSTGIGFAIESNETFNVQTIYPGTVVSVVEDDVIGTTVTVDHGENLISVYYSLEEIVVSEGDLLDSNSIIGTSGASTFDIKAGVHVHVEVISTIDNEYINVISIIGKTMDDIVSSIK
ncbi:MAG: M23 family metallopeptidase [bacterium]